MSEIPGSPLSRHDLQVIADAVARNFVGTYGLASEIHISTKRIPAVQGLKVGGIPVRRRGNLALNEGLLIFTHREPVPFDFERPDPDLGGDYAAEWKDGEAPNEP